MLKACESYIVTESIVYRFVNMLSMSIKGLVVQTSALALSSSMEVVKHFMCGWVYCGF